MSNSDNTIFARFSLCNIHCDATADFQMDRIDGLLSIKEEIAEVFDFDFDKYDSISKEAINLLDRLGVIMNWLNTEAQDHPLREMQQREADNCISITKRFIQKYKNTYNV
jgi:hypothetical protein